MRLSNKNMEKGIDVEKLKTMKEVFEAFNSMYGLPVNQKPTIPDLQRIKDFKNILTEEVNEVDEIIQIYERKQNNLSKEEKLEILTSLSDWLADMIWYIQSEAVKYGLDMEKTLDIIKGSNFSKLGADGKPIYDERGKVMKGPGFWKPEPKIKELILNSFEKN